MDFWPLLDIQAGVQDSDRALADVVACVETLQAESAGHYPPEAAALLANVAAIREMLGWLIPPALQQAI